MIFHTDKLICSVEELRAAVEDREFITYATVNSFRVAPRLRLDFRFVADGWPVAVYSTIRLRKLVRRLSFFKCERFWFEIARGRSIALVGHSEAELQEIEKRASSEGIYFKKLVSGYLEPEDIARRLKQLAGEVELIFLAVGQPKQERIMGLSALHQGEVAVVSCGAFWLQALGIESGVSRIPTTLGLVPLFRFYKKPVELLRRTVGSLPAMFRNLRAS